MGEYVWSATCGSFPWGNIGMDVVWQAQAAPPGVVTISITSPGGNDSVDVVVWDAEIEKCDGAWMPTKDGTVDITANIRPVGVSGIIKFILDEGGTSSQTGYCVNRGTATTKDLQFEAQAGFTISGPQNCFATTTSPVNSATVTASCYDYGAYGMMRVEVTVAGTTLDAHVVGGTDEYVLIPRDDDENHIADTWTYNNGNANDDNDTSLNNEYDGDGLTRYEEYRGVDIDENGEISEENERLNPNRKDLFVQGSGFGGGFPDFAYGEAFAEAQINVHEFVGTDDRGIDVLVVTLPDTGGHIYRRGDPYGVGIRDWTFSTLGSSSVGSGSTYGSPSVKKKATNYYFDDKPYDDHMTWTAPSMRTGNPNGVLDPVYPQRVEDCNDNGEVDEEIYYNEADGDLTPPADNTDQFLDGDHPIPSGESWDYEQELSPMDIDDDGLVTLPMDNQVPVPGDDEYTKTEVVQNVITHEIGHAVGIDYLDNDGHCVDSTCLMYMYTNNFSRDDHFCNGCRAKIRIHNN